jgi:hypothetical protein
MGTYFALRWIMTRLGGYQQAVDSACARARGALFAQRA